MTEEMIDSLSDVGSANITERERLAVRFAQLMATDHNSIGDEFFVELRSEFTDPEIFDLEMEILCNLKVNAAISQGDIFTLKVSNISIELDLLVLSQY